MTQGVKVVRTAIQAPNMNAVAERFVGSVKRECLSKLILFGDRHLQRVLSTFFAARNTTMAKYRSKFETDFGKA